MLTVPSTRTATTASARASRRDEKIATGMHSSTAKKHRHSRYMGDKHSRYHRVSQ